MGGIIAIRLKCSQLARLYFNAEGFADGADGHLRHIEAPGNAPRVAAGQFAVDQGIPHGVFHLSARRLFGFNGFLLGLIAE